MSNSSDHFPDLPPYTYVPGFAPHPISHPDGHMRDFELEATWSQLQHLQWGKRLFNNGFYWEAHEAWEHLWLELGRTTKDALIVKGLIKLAASGVKCLEGNSIGATRHATRAAELLMPGSEACLFETCDLSAARDAALQIALSPPLVSEPSSSPIKLDGFQL